MKKKGMILIAAALVLLAGALVYANQPRSTLLTNIEPEETQVNRDGIVDIFEEDVPMAEEPVQDDYAGLDETQVAYVKEVVELVNAARAKKGLQPLRLDPVLRAAAQIRAAECVKTFSHTRPDGRPYKSAIADAGVNASYTGENVASGYQSAQQVVDGWLNSPGHCANIMNEKFTRIGVGLEKNSGNGYRGYAWSQLFANDG